MRYRLALLMLFAVLTMMNILAGPTPKKARSPKVYALVDVGKWLKSVPHEKHREGVREWFTPDGFPWCGLRGTPIAKLNVIRAQKDAQAWISKNLHAEYVGKTDLLRIWLTSGSAAEQTVIINAILRFFLRFDVEGSRKHLQSGLEAYQRALATDAMLLPREEAELLRLDKAVPADGIEQENLWIQRNHQARSLATRKKNAAADRAHLEEHEAALRTLPHVIKWADKSRPAE